MPARLIDNPDLLASRLKATPVTAGVYLMRDAAAKVIYVGKAANLRSRLRSYFAARESHADRTRQLVERIFDFEIIACGSEREALLLENTLIKRYRPRFNIRLRDDKNYLYLKLPRIGATDVKGAGTAREGPRRKRDAGPSDFPRPYYTRRLNPDGARYFGPYTSAASLRTTVKTLRTIFPFRTCSDEIFGRGRVCLDYHIKRCSGPCEGRIDKENYSHLLDQVEEFMNGRTAAVETELRQQMERSATILDFEQAARVRDRLAAMDKLREKQTVVAALRGDEDCVALAESRGRVAAAVLSIRRGQVVGAETHEIEGAAEQSNAARMAGFLAQYYTSVPQIPGRFLLSDRPQEEDLLAEMLAQLRGGGVHLRQGLRGKPRALVQQAQQTALAALEQRRIAEDFDAEKNQTLLEALARALELDTVPQRIECYDVSNTMGTNSVSSLIVFEKGRPEPRQYRQFNIRTVEGSDDFASMRETLRRRFYRQLRAARQTGDDVPLDDPGGANGERSLDKVAEGASDESFAAVPDLILIDGGKGQLNVAADVLDEARLGDIPVFGLAKRNEELFRPQVNTPLVLSKDSPTLFLIQRIRDEAHRFAITRHRAKRSRAALRSQLDIIPGLGPARKRALLRQFGSVEGIRQAQLEELSRVIPRSVALVIKELL